MNDDLAAMREIFPELVADARELLSRADEILRGSVIEEAGAQALLRVFHTLKGNVSFVGLDDVSRRCHQLESLLKAASLPLADDVRVQVQEGADEVLEQLAAAERAMRPEAEADEPEQDLEPEPGTMRVDVRKIDRLLERVGELIVLESRLGHDGAAASISAERLRELRSITRGLRSVGTSIRMVPLHGLFDRMSRAARQLGRSLKKQVRVELEGASTEIDRRLVDLLYEPLIHLVRNAVDHGLRDSGVIRMRAKLQESTVTIEVEDDGRGLDRAAILASARARGLVDPDETPPPEAIDQLLFLPGLSTAQKVTQISGRGVGMDAVKTAVEQMRGRIRVRSRPQQGTTMEIVLPLTTALLDATVIDVGASRYVVPTLSLLEVRAAPKNCDAVEHEGQRLQTIPLRTWFKPGAPAANGELLLVMEATSGRFALLVDDVLGRQQLVVRAVRPFLNGTFFSGAAMLASGEIALILNPEALHLEGRKVAAA